MELFGEAEGKPDRCPEHSTLMELRKPQPRDTLCPWIVSWNPISPGSIVSGSLSLVGLYFWTFSFPVSWDHSMWCSPSLYEILSKHWVSLHMQQLRCLLSTLLWLMPLGSPLWNARLEWGSCFLLWPKPGSLFSTSSSWWVNLLFQTCSACLMFKEDLWVDDM